MPEKQATLNLTQEDGSEKKIDLTVHSGTLGPDVVDVGKLVEIPHRTVSAPEHGVDATTVNGGK